MSAPTSLIRSGLIADLYSSFNLLDPYQAFHPTRRDFTYFPNGAIKKQVMSQFFSNFRILARILEVL
jgi:hypothetical protein